MSIKRFHEAPKSIFKQVQDQTDGDYALVHLFEEDPEYFQLFKDAVKKGREVILDNSIFELGTAFNSSEYIKWINKLEPTWYIIPDTLESYQQTIMSAQRWKEHYFEKVSKKVKGCVGVVQGKTYGEIVECYKALDENIGVDMIAISFDYSLYETTIPHPNKYISWMLGRVKLISDLVEDGIINHDKPHHLLGIGLAIEGYFYRDYKFIYSIDTSNPVVHAIKRIKYNENIGLWDKSSEKLFKMINTPKTDISSGLLNYNISQFKKYWS